MESGFQQRLSTNNKQYARKGAEEIKSDDDWQQKWFL